MIDEIEFKQMMSAARNYTDQLNEDNATFINYYLRNPRGDEVIGESRAISSDCFDVVESDMPSVTRSLLGGGNIMEFKPGNADNKQEVLEAEQKTKLVNRVILGQDNSFKVMYDWLKAAAIYNFSAVTYYPRDTEKRAIKVYNGITKIELDSILQSLEDSDQVISADVVGDVDDSGGEFDVEIEIWRSEQEFVIEYINPDKFLISKGGPTIDDCSFVGHIDTMRKGELIEMGIPKAKVEAMSGGSNQYSGQASTYSDSSIITDIQEAAIGDDGNEECAPAWYLEEVEVITACVMGATKRGAPERRRIMWADNQIIKDEPFDHVNYAVLSAYPLPGSVIGLSRVAVTKNAQDQKTFVQRGMFNNMAQVNKPMTAVNISANGSAVNINDMRNRRAGGIVRVNGDPQFGIMPLVAPSIGAESLAMIQYLDFMRAQSTGALMASQGLNKDDLYNETATRFNGVQDEGAAKLENVLRVYAETGIKKLYRGVEWMLKHYQDSVLEEEVLGEQIAYSPSDWSHDSSVYSEVGLAADDTSELINNLGVIYNSQKELRMAGSTLVDESKLYNTLTKLMKAMNVHDNTAYFNDPKKPDQLLQAENEQQKQLIAQMQQAQQQNSLVAASKEIEQLKAQVATLKDKNKTSVDIAKLEEDARQFDAKLLQDSRQNTAKNAIDITKLELESNKDLNGGLDDK